MPSPPLAAFLRDLGADAPTGADLAERLASAGEPAVPGRVTRSERSAAEVLTPGGSVTVSWEDPVCTGDWVLVSLPAPESGEVPRVIYVQERRTTFVRRSADENRSQVLATNIDEIWMVVPSEQPLSAARIERTLVLAWESGADPVVVLTKTDVVPAPQIAMVSAEVNALAPGIPVVAVSTRTPDGTAGLADRLGPGRTAALLGPSGAGKSSLVNALAGTDLVVGAVRKGDSKGRHTTTWRELVVLPQGGAVIDTPGLRSVGLWFDEGGLAAAFSDITDRMAHCRFSDCAHEAEPGCAVQGAIVDGSLAPRRLDSYRKLEEELAWAGRRRDALALAEQHRAGSISRSSGRGRVPRH
ncbi:MAG: ribosome small subunit-dependent GTPase A [Acidimicrobiales bacterium]